MKIRIGKFIFTEFEFANDTWFGKNEINPLTNQPMSDKFAHYYRDYLLTILLFIILNLFFELKFPLSLLLSVFFATLFNLIWEIKDGFLNYLNCPSDAPKWVRYLYGDGFSIKDFISGILGSLSAVALILILILLKLNIFLSTLLIFIFSILIYTFYYEFIHKKI